MAVKRAHRVLRFASGKEAWAAQQLGTPSVLHCLAPEAERPGLVASSKFGGHGCSGVAVKVRDSSVQGKEFLCPPSSFEARLAAFLPALTARPEAALDATQLLPCRSMRLLDQVVVPGHGQHLTCGAARQTCTTARTRSGLPQPLTTAREAPTAGQRPPCQDQLSTKVS